MEKITKRSHFEALVNFAETGEMTFTNADGAKVAIDTEALKAFALNEIALLDKKAAKAKETAAKKKTEADALMTAVEDALTDELETIAAITAKIDGEDVTVSKVTYRLTQLVKAGVAEKGEVEVVSAEGKKRKVNGYKLVVTD